MWQVLKKSLLNEGIRKKPMEVKTSIPNGCLLLGPFTETRSGNWGATLRQAETHLLQDAHRCVQKECLGGSPGLGEHAAPSADPQRTQITSP